MSQENPEGLGSLELLGAFRTHHRRFEQAIEHAVSSNADSTVLARIGDDLDEYLAVLDESHHGRPVLVETIHSGERGRPSIYINPDFLRWAYGMRSVSAIARYLGVARSTVRNALLEHGIAQPQRNPFPQVLEPTDAPNQVDEQSDGVLAPDPEGDDILDPDIPVPNSLLSPLSNLTDEQLDALISQLRQHYCRAGISMLHGMLHNLGHRVPRERIRISLIRIDPVQRVFQRIRIRRRVYSVPGPNSLWHHDGQHGISVHNIRIERLWVDVTMQVGATWADRFESLQMHHGLDIDNPNHIWLLHHLFLLTINQELDFFAESWNAHHIRIRHGPSRSPNDMFYFDMFVHGVRGDQLPPHELEEMAQDELEVFGVDWEGLQEERILHSQQANNAPDEAPTSWIGRVGPPEHLNEVPVYSPDVPLSNQAVQILDQFLQPGMGRVDNNDIINLWLHGLTRARQLNSNLF
ncbi:hypothetical protein DFH11DRAFT_1518359 [Phellopilus nigrolimitatus]|nr:hypothetical protein DFH11DRAFT_1518359 [Phellopilus nigrolimitatus]